MSEVLRFSHLDARQPLCFHHHAHLRQLKTGSSPPVLLQHLAFWDGIGSSDNICRVILAVPVLFMPQPIQPTRNQSSLHLTSPLQLLPIRLRLFHLCMQKRIIVNGGSGLSETGNYPHKNKRVAMYLVIHWHLDASALACMVPPTPSASSINER